MKNNSIPYTWTMLDLDVDARRTGPRTVEIEVRCDAKPSPALVARVALESRGLHIADLVSFKPEPGAVRQRFEIRHFAGQRQPFSRFEVKP